LKAESRIYSVQPLRPDGEKDGGLVTTDAASAQQAAEKALGESLVLHGTVARAEVWTLTTGYTPALITLFVPQRDE
jgi:hypothetical protein